MPVRIDVTPGSGLLVVHDAALSLPPADRDKTDALERDAAAGKLFFLAAEDPIRFRADLYTEEALPPELQHDFQPLGGSFLLDLPSGRLLVAGYGSKAEGTSIAVPGGPHVLTLMERRPFDGSRHEKEMVALVGEADYRFSKRTTWLALLGCIPTILALGMLFLAIPRRQWSLFYIALPLVVLAWAPHALLRNSKRYHRIQRLMSEHEAAKPHFILKLVPTERTSGLSGGFVNI
jgi:hypothetical protein